MTKRIGVTGASGYIGRALMKQPNMISIDGDIRDARQIRKEIEFKKPDLLVHLAAITDVEFCEDRKNELAVKDVNVTATFDLGNICEDLDIGMVFLSTFQVFSGRKVFGSSYSEKDVPAPLNFYGLSKLTGEAYQAVYDKMKIVRAPYVFDYARLAPRISELRHQDADYPTFYIRSFMHLDSFVESLSRYIDNFDSMPPVLHISSKETITWYMFMSLVKLKLDLPCNVVARTKESNDFSASKPRKGGLNPNLSYSLGFNRYSYQDGLEFLKEKI